MEDNGMNQTPPPPTGSPVHIGAQPTPMQNVPVYRRSGGKGFIVGIVAIVGICIVMIVAIASCTSVVNNATSVFDFDSASDYDRSDNTPKIGMISISGTIQYDGTECSPAGLRSLLKQAEERDDIKAVVLRVDSGGGTSTAGEEMSHYVKEFSKPIVVSSASMNASAAYEISSQADYIYTAKSTAIGSIGTALELTDLSGLYEKLGIRIETITSSDSKDATYGNRPLTEEEKALYQNMVNQINDEFIRTVAEGRGMTDQEVRALATGMTFTGFQAIENGLADDIGYLEDAVSKASELSGSSKTLEYTRLKIPSSIGFRDIVELLGQSSSGDIESLKDLAAKLPEEKELG